MKNLEKMPFRKLIGAAEATKQRYFHKKLMGAAEPTIQGSFQIVGDKVIAIMIASLPPQVFCRDETSFDTARNALTGACMTPPEISVSLSEATQDELEAVKRAQPKRSPNIAAIDSLIEFLKGKRAAVAAAAIPVRVEITNLKDFQKDSVVRITRDSSGKIEGATSIRA